VTANYLVGENFSALATSGRLIHAVGHDQDRAPIQLQMPETGMRHRVLRDSSGTSARNKAEVQRMQHPFLAMDRSGRYIHYHAAWGIVPLRPDESDPTQALDKGK
jgi:hypothetical protein